MMYEELHESSLRNDAIEAWLAAVDDAGTEPPLPVVVDLIAKGLLFGLPLETIPLSKSTFDENNEVKTEVLDPLHAAFRDEKETDVAMFFLRVRLQQIHLLHVSTEESNSHMIKKTTGVK